MPREQLEQHLCPDLPLGPTPRPRSSSPGRGTGGPAGRPQPPWRRADVLGATAPATPLTHRADRSWGRIWRLSEVRNPAGRLTGRDLRQSRLRCRSSRLTVRAVHVDQLDPGTQAAAPGCASLGCCPRRPPFGTSSPPRGAHHGRRAAPPDWSLPRPDRCPPPVHPRQVRVIPAARPGSRSPLPAVRAASGPTLIPAVTAAIAWRGPGPFGGPAKQHPLQHHKLGVHPLELALSTGDAERLVAQMSELRRESLKALGRQLDDLEARAE